LAAGSRGGRGGAGAEVVNGDSVNGPRSRCEDDILFRGPWR